MFAYCRNNPVSRKDASGTADISYTTDDDTPWDDMIPDNLGRGGAGGGGNSSAGNGGTGGGTAGGSPSGSGYSYTPPPGGGGVTTQINVDGTTVSFGHGGRHLDFSDISGLEDAIAHDVVTRPPTTGYRGEYNILYSNTWFTYRYWTLGPQHIKVGTYFYAKFG